MKYTLLGILFMILLAVVTSGQTLEIDNFKDVQIKRTSWESLNKSNKKEPATVYFNFSKMNDRYYLNLKILIYTGLRLQAFHIDKDEELILKLDNNEYVDLYNYQYAKSCDGCGSVGLRGSLGEGIEVTYLLRTEELESFQNNKVVRIRIFTSEGYADCFIKNKDAVIFQNAATIIEKVEIK
jgi:hypothetical protein